MLERKYRHGRMGLVSALVAFALVVAHVVGAYAHAAGHHHAKGHASCAHQEISAAATFSGAQDDGEHRDDPTNHIDTFDFMCNGGIAILAAPAFAFAGVKSPHASTIVDIASLLLPASLERPPKSAVCA